MELEGLRGIAAVMVVLAHFSFLFFPALRNGDMSLAHSRYEDNVYGTPLMVFVAGSLAVAIFFVLSGFVLSIGFFKTGDQNIVKKLATGRYLRLMLPALVSVLIAFVLITFGAHALTSAAGDIANSTYLAGKWHHSPTFLEALKTATFDIFAEYKPESRAINHALWTMNVEFIGSFLVFGFLLIFAKSRFRWVAYAILIVGTLGTWYLGFVIGMMIADAYNLGWLERLRHWSVTVPMAVVAIFLGIFPKKHENTIYEFLDLSFFGFSERIVYLTFSATLIVLVVLLSKTTARVLQTRLLSSLGKYTFSLYLTHLSVIYTVSTSVVLLLHERIGYNWAVLVSALVSVPFFWLVSYFFERYVDAPSIKFAKYVSAIYRNDREIDWPGRKNAAVVKAKGGFRRKKQDLGTRAAP